MRNAILRNHLMITDCCFSDILSATNYISYDNYGLAFRISLFQTHLVRELGFHVFVDISDVESSDVFFNATEKG